METCYWKICRLAPFEIPRGIIFIDLQKLEIKEKQRKRPSPESSREWLKNESSISQYQLFLKGRWGVVIIQLSPLLGLIWCALFTKIWYWSQSSGNSKLYYWLRHKQEGSPAEKGHHQHDGSLEIVNRKSLVMDSMFHLKTGRIFEKKKKMPEADWVLTICADWEDDKGRCSEGKDEMTLMLSLPKIWLYCEWLSASNYFCIITHFHSGIGSMVMKQKQFKEFKVRQEKSYQSRTLAKMTSEVEVLKSRR